MKVGDRVKTKLGENGFSYTFDPANGVITDMIKSVPLAIVKVEGQEESWIYPLERLSIVPSIRESIRKIEEILKPSTMEYKLTSCTVCAVDFKPDDNTHIEVEPCFKGYGRGWIFHTGKCHVIFEEKIKPHFNQVPDSIVTPYEDLFHEEEDDNERGYNSSNEDSDGFDED